MSNIDLLSALEMEDADLCKFLLDDTIWNDNDTSHTTDNYMVSNSKNVQTDEYHNFIMGLSLYISINTVYSNRTQLIQCDFMQELYKIIHSYIILNITFLVDFSQKNDKILSDTKIICLSIKSLFNDITNTEDNDSIYLAGLLWLVFDNNMIREYDFNKNKFTQQLQNWVQNVYPNFGRNPNEYGTLSNIKSCCLKHGIEGHFKWIFYVANGGYDSTHFVHTHRYKPPNTFMFVRDNHWVHGTGNCYCNYITSELYCIMGWIDAMSAGEHYFYPQTSKTYNNIVVFEYDKKLNKFKQLIRKFNFCHLFDFSGYVCTYLSDINQLLNVSQHVILNEDNENWMMYLPITIYKKYKQVTFEENILDAIIYMLIYDEININKIQYLYRMTKEYVLLRGRKKSKSESLNLVKILNIDCSKFNIFDQFDCVLNDYFNHRFIASNGSMLFQIRKNWTCQEF